MNTRSYKTVSANKATVNPKWVVIDVEGKVLGRVASKIASLLRGKHKTYYTPHVDCGDNVIVINAAKVRFTGNKLEQKEYLRHTGYPGGQRSVLLKNMLEKFPERVIENAVRGMLPKSKLGRQMFKKMRVYAGAEHAHEAQTPEAIEV